jgi:hypothetical protein
MPTTVEPPRTFDIGSLAFMREVAWIRPSLSCKRTFM